MLFDSKIFWFWAGFVGYRVGRCGGFTVCRCQQGFLKVAWAESCVFVMLAWRDIWWSALAESLLCCNFTSLHLPTTFVPSFFLASSCIAFTRESL